MPAADPRSNSSLITAIYDAALDPQAWPGLLEGLCEATQSAGAMLISMDLRQPQASRVVFARLDPSLMKAYLRNHAAVDPWTTVAAALPVGPAVALDAFVPQRTLLRSALYADILRAKDIRHALTSILRRDEDRVAAVSLYRNGRTGAFESDTRAQVDGWAPHLRRAEDIGSRFDRALALQASMAAALHALTQGVVLLGADARLLFANRRAEEVLGCDDALRLTGGRLGAKDAADAARLRALLSRAVQGCGGSLRLARSAGRRPILLQAAPVAEGRVDAVHPAAAVVVLLTDIDPGPAPDTQALGALFGLTRAEARVAAGVARGDGVPQLARQLGSSPNTVHTHLRRLFAKCGVNSQAALAAVLQRASTFRTGPDIT